MPGCETESSRSARFVAGSLSRSMCVFSSTIVFEPSPTPTMASRLSTVCAPRPSGWSKRTTLRASVCGTNTRPSSGLTDTSKSVVPSEEKLARVVTCSVGTSISNRSTSLRRTGRQALQSCPISSSQRPVASLNCTMSPTRGTPSAGSTRLGLRTSPGGSGGCGGGGLVHVMSFSPRAPRRAPESPLVLAAMTLACTTVVWLPEFIGMAKTVCPPGATASARMSTPSRDSTCGAASRSARS
jgi:hypothetical protein